MILQDFKTTFEKMHISSLEIKNFRGIKHLEIDDLKRVNIFLGKNNVGKTTILEAIFLSLAPGNPQMTIGINNMRSLFHTTSEDFKFIFYQMNFENQIEIISKYRYNGLEKDLKISANAQGSTTVTQNGITDVGLSITQAEKTTVKGLNLNYSYKKKGSKRESFLAKIFLDDKGVFQQTSAKTPETLLATFVTQGALHTNLSLQLEKILIDKKENEIVGFLKPVDKTIESLSLGTNNVILVDTGFGKRYPLNLLGDGAVRMVAILLAIYNSAGGVLLIDEFSNGLHYTALRGLWQAIFKASEINRVQVFVTTHDYEALVHLKKILDEDQYAKYQNEIRSYTISKISEGEFKSYKYDFADLEFAIGENNELR